jgi:hypothetical protein
MKPWSARASRETCYKQSMTLADLNALWPADAHATPWVRRRTDHGPAWSAPASIRTSRPRGASERARGQVVRPSDLRHLDGTPVQSSLSRCSSSGRPAILTAIRRASSFVSTFAWRASASLSRE